MYEVGKSILNLMLLISTVWIIYRVLGTFFEKRKWTVLSWLSWGILIAFQAFVEFRDQFGNGWLLLGVIMTLILVISICYQGSAIKKLLIVAFLYAICSGVEMIVSSFMRGVSLDDRRQYDIGETLSKMIMIFLVFLFRAMVKKNGKSDIALRYNILLLFIPAGSIFVMYNQFQMISQEVNFVFSFISFGILLLINILVFEIYLKLIQLFRQENEQTAYIRQLDFIANQINEQSRFTEEFHRERHDLANQLVVIRECVESGERENAVESLNRIIKSDDNGYSISRSGNAVVDAVINFKYAAARECGIRFVLRIFIPEKLPVDQCDLGIVLGNALDNAIEAAGACPEEDRRIEIRMGVKKDALILVVKNPYAHDLKHSEAGELLSTKKDSQRHGYGLKSIQRTAERYSGEVLIDEKNRVFCLTVIMNLQQTEMKEEQGNSRRDESEEKE